MQAALDAFEVAFGPPVGCKACQLPAEVRATLDAALRGPQRSVQMLLAWLRAPTAARGCGASGPAVDRLTARHIRYHRDEGHHAQG